MRKVSRGELWKRGFKETKEACVSPHTGAQGNLRQSLIVERSRKDDGGQIVGAHWRLSVLDEREVVYCVMRRHINPKVHQNKQRKYKYVERAHKRGRLARGVGPTGQ